MSADAWSVCPRCKANGDIGYRGNEFREDFGVGMNEDTGTVEITYRGECQRCNLLVTFTHQHPAPGMSGLERAPEPEPNRPDLSVEPEQRAWMHIPAGWFVRTPAGAYLEVRASRERGAKQEVTLRFPDGQEGTWPQPRATRVQAVPGTVMGEVGTAIAILGGKVEIIEDEVS